MCANKALSIDRWQICPALPMIAGYGHIFQHITFDWSLTKNFQLKVFTQNKNFKATWLDEFWMTFFFPGRQIASEAVMSQEVC